MDMSGRSALTRRNMIIGGAAAAALAWGDRSRAAGPIDRPSTQPTRGEPTQVTSPGLALIEIGRSALGAPIIAKSHQIVRPRTKLLVVGTVHGSEPDTAAVCDAIFDDVGANPSASVETWVLPIMNPDGYRRETRRNARNVDLNRNFPHRWTGAEFGGPSPASEPETRALMTFVRYLQPDVAVFLHQPLEYVSPIGTYSSSALANAWRMPLGLAHGRWVNQPGGAESWCGFQMGIPTLLVEAKSSYVRGGIDVAGNVRGHRALVTLLERIRPRSSRP
jgi:hypothetical protein